MNKKTREEVHVVCSRCGACYFGDEKAAEDCEHCKE